MIINKTEQALKGVAIQFSVNNSITWEVALRQTMKIINTNSRDQAVTVMGRVIKELHD